MFDKARFDAMPKYDEFTLWFIRTSETTFAYGQKELWEGGKLPNDENIKTLDTAEDFPDELIQKEFGMFQKRPEYAVGKPVQLDLSGILNNSQESMIDAFETIMMGVAFIRMKNAGKNPDDGFASGTRFLDWIRQNTDFYTAPGSTRFHDAEPTGLLFHSLHVYNNMVEMKKISKFSRTAYHSIALISLCHDFTKIGNYEKYMKNVKDDNTGAWEQVPAFRWKGNPFPFGHGVSSMYIVSQFFKLSIEEMLAIRWHMGEYSVSEHETGELEDACERYPLVRMVQFADQLACVKF